MTDLVRRFTEARLDAYLPVIRDWQPGVRERLEADVREALDRTEDEEFGGRIMEHTSVDGLDSPSDYTDTVIELADGSLALTGIRFRARDTSRPFVDIIVLEGGSDTERLHGVIETITSRWDAFGPLCVRLPAPSADTVDVAAFGPNSRVDLRFVAGRIDELSATPHQPIDGLTVEVAQDMSWYERYRREYDLFLAGDPARVNWTQPEAYDPLARSVDESAVHLVRMGGEFSGVYALPPDEVHGLRGFRVQDKLLFGSVRGKGVGAAAEYAVLERLPARPDDVLIGSIEEGNLASRRSAYRVGRVDIGVKLWLTPRGRSGMPF